MTNYPELGIRPVINGRLGGVRESSEYQSMGMAKKANTLIDTHLKYPDIQVVKCVISDTVFWNTLKTEDCGSNYHRKGADHILDVSAKWIEDTHCNEKKSILRAAYDLNPEESDNRTCRTDGHLYKQKHDR